MRPESQCLAHERYLIADCYLSDEAVLLWQNDTVKRFINRDKTDLYYKYINWKKKPNEIAVFTIYAYADFEVPKYFNCLFDINDPDNYITVNYKLLQSIYEGWAPINTIEHGYKHLCILEFAEDTIPSLLYSLYKETGLKDTRQKIHTKIGLCNTDDYNEITTNIKENTLLRLK